MRDAASAPFWRRRSVVPARPALRWGLACLALGLLLAGVPAAAIRTEQAGGKLEELTRDLERGLQYKRILVLEQLAKLGTPAARGVIIRTMLYDRSQPVRRAAQRMLADVQDPRVLPAIREALGDKSRKVRLAAVDALALVRDPAGADLLLDAMDADPRDTKLARAALESLRQFVYRTEPAPGFERRLLPWLQSRNKKLRQTTLTILGILGRPDTLPALTAMWPKADRALKIRLADAFANIGWKDPVPLLTAELSDPHDPVVIHCLYALSQIQSFDALPQIWEVLEKRRDPWVQITCLNALIEIPDQDSIPKILPLLDSPDANVRHWAAYALSQLHAQSAAPKLEAKLKDPSDLVRASAVTALGELGGKTAARSVWELLQDPNESNEVHIAASKALMRLGFKQDAEFYWQELQKPDLDTNVRLTYALALGQLHDEKLRDRLAAELASPDFSRSFSAALALGVMGDEQAGGLLVHTLDHGNPAIRRFAILGLEGLRGQEVLKALADTANDDRDPLVRILCASSLVAAGFVDFRVLLWNALDNPDEDVRSEAVIALGRSADAETLRQLKWYLRREPSVPVRQTILRVLREAEDHDSTRAETARDSICGLRRPDRRSAQVS